MKKLPPLPRPLTLQELKKLRTPIKNVNTLHRQRLSDLDKFAMWMNANVGTMGFFIILTIWSIAWLAWNTYAPIEWQFDPYPSLVIWFWISELIQITFIPLVMVGQNLQNRHAETRAQQDYEINTKAEREIETILMHLEDQNKVMQKILKQLEKQGGTSQKTVNNPKVE